MDTVIAVLHIHKRNMKTDIEIPLDLSANELITGLNESFGLEMDTDNLTSCYLKTENPIALLKGNKTLREYGLRDGTVINVTG